MFALFPWFIVLAVAAMIWWRAMGARASARRAARAACREAEMRFIDELAFKHIGLGRDHGGHWCVIRRYGFEFFESGERRYSGTVEMHGQRVARVYMGPRPLRDGARSP